MFWMFVLLGFLPGGEAPAAPAVPAESLSEWLHYLASDEMKGRDNGSPEMDEAAEWIAARYREFGLQTVPGQDSFFQSFEATKPRRRGQPEPETPPEPVTVRNVIGYLPGSDPELRDEYIVLTAHYDHVGIDTSKPAEDQLMNGADDDASGVVTILGMAASLQRQNIRPKRSIVWIAWAAEEWGLLGSKHYVKDPWLPLDKMVVNLNYELTGHSTNTGSNKFWMTGGAYSDLSEVIGQVAQDHGWELIDNPFKQMNLFFRSDNASFAILDLNRETREATGIPAHAFSTWGGEDHYHEPHDEPEAVDYQNLAGLVQVMTAALHHLADRPEWVQWQDNEDFTFTRPAASE